MEARNKKVLGSTVKQLAENMHIRHRMGGRLGIRVDIYDYRLDERMAMNRISELVERFNGLMLIRRIGREQVDDHIAQQFRLIGVGMLPVRHDLRNGSYKSIFNFMIRCRLNNVIEAAELNALLGILERRMGGQQNSQHRRINRTNLSKEQIDYALTTAVVQKQLEMLRFRSSFPAFAMDSVISIEAEGHQMSFTWEKDGYTATLRTDLQAMTYELEGIRRGGNEDDQIRIS